MLTPLQLMLLPLLALGASIDIAPPSAGIYVLDHVGILSVEDEARINEISETLLRDQAVPLYVVTIESMALHTEKRRSIESFAWTLLREWNAETAPRHNLKPERNILLLVSTEDRKARIELGAAWGRSHDERSEFIMNQQIIPQFKRGNLPAGILAGAMGLEGMARGVEHTRSNSPSDTVAFLTIAGVAGLIILLVAMAAHNKTSRAVGNLGRPLLSGPGSAVNGLTKKKKHATSSSSTNSSIWGIGGFGGGGFGGGGFSGGGGGATGSW